MTDHTNCCCTETLNDHLALQAAYGAACRDRDELEERLLEALAERDRARALAARLEAEAAQPYLPAGPFPPHRYPTPIIEWLASVGLDA